MRAVVFFVVALVAQPAAALTFFSVGAGDLNGAYFRAARAICELVNRGAAGRLRCSPEATQGSIANLSGLGSGDLAFALVQSDWQRRAVEGTSIFADAGPMSDLRAVMSLHAEPFTLLVRADAGIAGVQDLSGRRVDLGHPSSGRRATTEEILAAFGLDESAFAEIYELQSGAAVSELCAGRIDATFLIIGHPNTTVARALSECGATIAPIVGDGVDRLVAGTGLYDHAAIPSGAYPELVAPVRTFGVTATMVTLADTPDALVEAMVGATLGNLSLLARRAPVLGGLDKTQMGTRGLTAPLHPAAARLFDAGTGTP
jgi:TRAP transporter TAXI family solute receptor